MNCKKYVAPAIEIITMQTEGMIAGSATNGNLTIGSGDFTIGPGEGNMGAAEQRKARLIQTKQLDFRCKL